MKDDYLEMGLSSGSIYGRRGELTVLPLGKGYYHTGSHIGGGGRWFRLIIKCHVSE